jgi:hypothetical protein
MNQKKLFSRALPNYSPVIASLRSRRGNPVVGPVDTGLPRRDTPSSQRRGE